MDCGAFPHEIEHALEGKHTYAEWRIFGQLSLVLCNVCRLDFASYDPTFFGSPKNAHGSLEKMDLIRSMDKIRIGKDKYCRQCGKRLAFLTFVRQARTLHGYKEEEVG